MIAEVRRIARLLGRATPDALWLESGLAREEVETAVAFLLERGYLRAVDVGAAEDEAAPARPCAGCPLVGSCTLPERVSPLPAVVEVVPRSGALRR